MKCLQGKLGAAAAAVVIIVFPILVPSTYYLNTLTLMALFGVSALGMNLLMGVAGQISLGQAGFMTIGAYTSSLLIVNAGLPMWGGVVAAAVVSAVVGFLLGLPALRLQGNYLALATLGFASAIRPLLNNQQEITMGDIGFSVPGFSSAPVAFWSALAALIFLAWLAGNIVKSKPGRALLALRDDEVAAQAMGVNLVTAKTAIFAFSAAYAGIAGAMITLVSGYITPRDFTLTTTFALLAGIVVGGLGSIPGGIIGAALITLLPIATSRTAGLSTVIEGVSIILIVMFAPKGLVSIRLWAGKGNHRVNA